MLDLNLYCFEANFAKLLTSVGLEPTTSKYHLTVRSLVRYPIVPRGLAIILKTADKVFYLRENPLGDRQFSILPLVSIHNMYSNEHRNGPLEAYSSIEDLPTFSHLPIMENVW